MRQRLLSTSLAVLAGLLLLIGGIGTYARGQIVDDDAFSDRVASTLDERPVRELVTRQVVDALIARASADLLTVRPLLESAVGVIIDTRQFRRLFALAVRDAHGVMLGTRASSVILDLDRAGALLAETLRSVSPAVARKLPADVEPQLARLEAGDFRIAGARGLRRIAALSPVLLIAAALAAAASIAMAPSRRRALSRLGVAVTASSAVGALTVTTAGWVVEREAAAAAGRAGDEDEALVGPAVEAVWEGVFGDLVAASLLVAAVGLAFAAVGAGVVGARQLLEPSRRARAVLLSPTPGARTVRGLLALAAGAGLIAEPDLAVRVLTLAVGGLLLFVGASELTAALSRGSADAPDSTLPGQLMTGVAVLAVAATGVLLVAATVSSDGPGGRRVAAPAAGCNGDRALCDRRLNEVVFPATHNAFAAADLPGWLFANQRRSIERQLEDGIRGLLLDVHYGVRDPMSGHVRTDLRAEGTTRNRVARELTPEALAVADRLAGRAGLGKVDGPREAYLCHTLCELGSRPLVDALASIRRFLARRRTEVLFLVVEPYVPPGEIERALRESQLLENVAVLRRDRPLPTLGELVERDERLIILTERDAGARPWYHDAFSFAQDTPLGATSAAELRCTRGRGSADSPLLILNHWIDAFPPSPTRNAGIGGSFLRRRAGRCAAERGLTPNLLAVDFYERSAVVEVARELNRR